jgi:2-aminoadipate transaminase
MGFEHLLAQRTERMSASAIREILKVTAQPGVVSLAGGLPAPESFPLGIMSELTTRVLNKYGPEAFQYGPTEGFPPLLPVLAQYAAQRGVKASPGDVLVASGSQGVLDAVGKVLITKGDAVAVEAPTYLGALQAFNPYEPEYVRLDTDQDGLIPESLERVLKQRFVKFIYLVPTFQNPTGRTIPLARRQRIAALLQEFNALLVEDDPYSALRYRGREVPAIKSLAPDHVVYVSTLSKVFAPGLRLGFCVAPPLLRRWMVMVKQGVDLHTSSFTQALATEYLSGGYLNDHLPRILAVYQPKQEAMLKALDQYFPKDYTWTRPDGGMFIWVSGPKGLDMETLLAQTLKKNVAFVPGKFFFTEPGEGLETLRLNYTNADESTVEQAVKTLAEVIEEGF